MQQHQQRVPTAAFSELLLPDVMTNEELIRAWREVASVLREKKSEDVDKVSAIFRGVIEELSERAGAAISEKRLDRDQLVECTALISSLGEVRVDGVEAAIKRLQVSFLAAACRELREDLDLGRDSADGPLLQSSAGAPHRQFHLRLAYLWLRRRWHFVSLARHNAFFELLASAFLSLPAARSLQVPEFVFLMYLSGQLRRIPGLGLEHRPRDGVVIPDYLASKLIASADDLSWSELNIVLAAIQRCHIQLHYHDDVMKLLAEKLRSSPPAELVANTRSVGTVCKVITGTVVLRQDETQAMMEKYRPLQDSFDASTRMRLLAFFAGNRPVDAGPYVADFCRSMEPELPNLRIKDLGKMLYALFKMNQTTASRAFLERVSETLSCTGRNHFQDGLWLIYGVGYLARMNVFNSRLMEVIFESANASGEKLVTAPSDNERIDATFEIANRLVSNHLLRREQHYSVDSLAIRLLSDIAETDMLYELFAADEEGGSGALKTRLHPDVRAKTINVKRTTEQHRTAQYNNIKKVRRSTDRVTSNR